MLVRCALALTLIYSVNGVAQITLNPLPTRALGQDSTTLVGVAPNLVEGREFLDPQGIALDLSTNPPALYVSDTGNNRVLGFRSAAGYATGQTADIVLGQPDLRTTIAGGSPHGGSNTALYTPTGITVDGSGNVYVVDAGNNRILRFPRPFAQIGPPAPDLVIGQLDFTTIGVNQGGISSSTLNFNPSGTPFDAYLAFDASGNLWVADAANNRVLRFNASALGAQAVNGPAADLVLGQPDFVTNSYSPNPKINPLVSTAAFQTPSGIAFDSKGRLFVMESTTTRRARVLVWTPPFVSGQSATRILGVDVDTPQPPVISEFQFGPATGNLFPFGDGIGVTDTVNSRILIFAPVEQWTPNPLYQAAIGLAGQADFNSGSANQGQPAPSASTLSAPVAAAAWNSTLYVADSQNHRVVAFPHNGSGFGPATAVLGQDGFNFNTANLIEGREFDFTAGHDAGVVVDTASNPPHLYVADTYNNRVLGFRDLRTATSGGKADLVLGQPGFQTSEVNYPANDSGIRTGSSLYSPIGLAVDNSGNLYVADTGNGRVLRFPKPFEHYAPGVMQPADLVLGQVDFTNKITDTTSRTMGAPYGLAFTIDSGLAVSDVLENRVLWFQGTPEQFTSGMAATLVLGQPDFTSTDAGAEMNQLHAPRHITTDVDDRLFVSDAGNFRVLAFDRIPLASNGAYSAYSLGSRAGLRQPVGVTVNKLTNELWVSDPAGNAEMRFPQYSDIVASDCNNCGTALTEVAPLASAFDAWGDLYVADSANRIAVHYPGVNAVNAANYLPNRPLAPGMIATLFPLSGGFGGSGQQAAAVPLPSELNGVEVLFNGEPAPLFYAGPGQINFQVPMSAPQSGIADIEVLEVSDQRVLGSWPVTMNSVSPGLFTTTASGTGAATALNQDNTVNSAANPAMAGSIIQLFGTGQGFLSGAPADGNSALGAVATTDRPQVIIGAGFVDDSSITWSGLAPALVGVWQINVRIPKNLITLPNNPVQVVIVSDGIASGGGGIGRMVQIYVKQP